MIERFRYYLDKALVKKEFPNKEEARSLMERARERLEYIQKQKIDKFSASFIFEDVYESLREAAQSLMFLRGYKPYSHEALVSFLREFYNFSEAEVSAFDRYRKLRNKCIYRAAKVSTFVCREALKFLTSFLPKLKRAFDKEVS